MKTAIYLCLCCMSTFAAAAESKVTVVPVDTKLADPFGVEFDQSGTMYVIDYGSHRLIRLKDGRAEVGAGNGQKGFAGDGGPAGKSQLNSPHNIAIGPGGDIYIAVSGRSTPRVASSAHLPERGRRVLAATVGRPARRNLGISTVSRSIRNSSGCIWPTWIIAASARSI